MKALKFDHDKCAWDEYRAFHVGVTRSGVAVPTRYWPQSPLVLFESGELMVRGSTYRRPYDRGYYPILNISLLTTRDVPLLTPEGEPIPKAQLNWGGQQHILVDWDSRRVVGLGEWGLSPLTNVPQRFEQSRAYIPAPGALPVGRPIQRWSNKWHDPELLEQARERQKILSVQAKLLNRSCSIWWGRCQAVTVSELLKAPTDITTLLEYQLGRLVNGPIDRACKDEPYLLVPEGLNPEHY